MTQILAHIDSGMDTHRFMSLTKSKHDHLSHNTCVNNLVYDFFLDDI